MSRDIDRLLDYVRDLDWLPPVHRQVVINRIDAGPPTQEELDRAAAQVDRIRDR
jgi:hypothetical protein